MNQTIPTWEPEPLWKRLNSCALLLNIHGCISDSDWAKIHKRLMKLKEQANAADQPPDRDQTDPDAQRLADDGNPNADG